MAEGLLLAVANWSTLSACLVLKVPQGLALLAARSARGFSLEGLLLELAGFLVCLRYMSYYNYPLPTYIEYPIIIVQDVILLLFVLHYTGKLKHALPYTAIFVSGWYIIALQKWILDLTMFLERSSHPVLREMYGYQEPTVQPSWFGVKDQDRLLTWHRDMIPFLAKSGDLNLSTLISAASKLMQLRCLWQTKDSGQVSAATLGLAIYTCTTRIFTTLMTTNDATVLVRFIVVLALNIWILATVVYYRKGAKKVD